MNNGLIIGSTFVAGMPIAMFPIFIRRRKDWKGDRCVHACGCSGGLQRSHPVPWSQRDGRIMVFVLAALTVPCSLLLFIWPNTYGTSFGLWSIIVSDTFSYASAYSCQGMVEGFAFTYAMQPHPSGWSQENYIITTALLYDTGGRFLGPPLGRWLIGAYGRSAYAGVQLFLSVLSLATVFSFMNLLHAPTHATERTPLKGGRSV